MELSSEVLKMRDALLDRIGDKPLKDVAQIVNEILLNETDSTNRLAALSARVKVLRDYINQNYDVKQKADKKLRSAKIQIEPETDKKVDEIINTNNSEEIENWVRVEMLKAGVVNGVRFPQGVIIDVSNADATKLVAQSLSKIIEVEDNSSKEKSSDQKDNEENLKTGKEVPLKKLEEIKSEGIKKQKQTKTEDLVTKEETKKTSNTSSSEIIQEDINAQEEPKQTKTEDLVTKEETKKTSNTSSSEKIEAKATDQIAERNEIENLIADKKILKKKSTKITEETIELTDPKAVAEALGLNQKKKKEEEPQEIEEEIDIEALETGKKK